MIKRGATALSDTYHWLDIHVSNFLAACQSDEADFYPETLLNMSVTLPETNPDSSHGDCMVDRIIRQNTD